MLMRLDHLPHLKYKPEIDGLRAVAVLAVILFHAGVDLPGGFVGVDIFYVISGFLITKIIVIALHQGSFSFVEFYARRVKRLLPAALLMMLVTLAFGYWMLAPDKYVELAKATIYASLFLANVWFSMRSGYFDQSTEISPLVHMWSLAVEEQFYLLFPLLLVLSYRVLRLRGIFILTAMVFVFSLSLSVLASSRYPNFSFYLLPTRAWELAVGGMLVFLSLGRCRNAAVSNVSFLVGSALIVYGLLFVGPDQPYPGWRALFPVIGAALLIVSVHSGETIGTRLLKWPPLVLIGKFSYSAYLWHWPIVVYYRIYVSEREFAQYEVAALVLVSIGAGYLSWRFVEEKFRYWRQLPLRTLAIGNLAMACTVVAALVVHAAHGFPTRFTDSAKAISDAKAMWSWSCTEERRLFPGLDQSFCVVGEPWDGARVKGLIWGDSHSLHWAPVFHQLARDRGMSLIIAPENCPPYLGSGDVREDYPRFPRFTEDCTLRHRLTLAWLADNSDVRLIVMAAAWSGHVRMLYTDDVRDNLQASAELTERSGAVGAVLSAQALRATLASIDLKNRHVLLLGEVPRPNRNLNDCALAELGLLLRATCEHPYRNLDAEQIREWHRHSDQALSEVASSFTQVDVILPVLVMCAERHCPTYLNGELLYMDGNHVRRNLSPETIRQLAETLGLSTYLERF